MADKEPPMSKDTPMTRTMIAGTFATVALAIALPASAAVAAPGGGHGRTCTANSSGLLAGCVAQQRTVGSHVQVRSRTLVTPTTMAWGPWSPWANVGGRWAVGHLGG